MNNYGSQIRLANPLSRNSYRSSLRWLYVVLALGLTGLTTSLALEDPDEVYLRVYKMIERADTLKQNGQSESATLKYQEAQTNLMQFKKSFPGWNNKLVAYRLNYIGEGIAALSQPAPTPAPAITPAEQTTPAPVASTTPQVTATQIKLLEAGAEPRQTLRFHPKLGSEQAIVMSVKTALDSGLGKAMVMPTVKLTINTTVKSVSADGNIAYELAVTDASAMEDPDAMPEITALLKTSLEEAKGVVITGTLSDRGIPIGAGKAKTTSSSNPQARQFIEQMRESVSSLVCPLPAEAIGVGAKWEAKMPLKSQGMTIQQTVNYEVASIKEDNLQTKFSIAQTATNQKMESPAMPGMKLEIPQMTGTITGTSGFSLTHPFPSQATMDSRSEVLIKMGAQKQSMTMKSDTNVRIEPK